MRKIIVPKKIMVWAMRNRSISMATHYTILNNGVIHSKLIISQPMFNIERQSWYLIKEKGSQKYTVFPLKVLAKLKSLKQTAWKSDIYF